MTKALTTEQKAAAFEMMVRLDMTAYIYGGRVEVLVDGMTQHKAEIGEEVIKSDVEVQMAAIYEAMCECRDMLTEDDTEEGGYCPACSGSGEGMFDGTTCGTCRGRGEA